MTNHKLNKKSKVLISNTSDDDVINMLRDLNNDVILLPEYDKLPFPVASHADMLFFAYRKKLFCFAEYLNANKELFENLNADLFPIAQTPTPDYPNDIILNSVLLKENSDHPFILGLEKFMSKELKALPERKVNVKQGYTHCSCCVVGENSVITADKGISDSCKQNGVDTLLIAPENINLKGYNTGFIGGASGIVGGTLCFFGDPYTHIDGEKIIRFTEQKISEGKAFVKNIKYISGPLRDYGGLVFLPQ